MSGELGPDLTDAPQTPLRKVRATRYVTAFREGGSLPGLVEADDDGLYVVKFRGAGQGPRALVAEWLVGEIGRSIGLLVPDIVLVALDRAIAESEPHEEIHDLLVASVGKNIGIDFLPGAITFNPAVDRVADTDWAADVVWLDGFATNPDRTVKNTNMLVWHGRTWLIDHGAGLYVHHAWRNPEEQASRASVDRIGDHVLLPFASSIETAHERLAPRVRHELIDHLVDEIPDDWLPEDPVAGNADVQRAAYRRYLTGRLESAAFVGPTERARLAVAA
ncbi:MAG TPA: HipA family kinase [Candidatus Limnocylindrales bacterium]|nr:HipA family kinase [Candidatus Limnocylindrales bacterium]